jgi:DNA polymerase
MVVGEAPGEQEDLQGEAFVGRSGELLNDILAALQLTRGAAAPERQVFIANAVKCRPPENRTPRPEEVSACAPFLDRQLALVQPRLVVALGKVAAQRLLQTEAPVGSLRGKVHRRQDGLHVVVSYHPSYLLRQPLEKARAWEDWCLAAEWMNR